MYFKKAFEGKNDWWRYVIVILVVSFGYLIGQLPLSLALYRSITNNPELDTSDLQAFQDNPDFGLFGINPNMGFTLLLTMFVGALVAFYFVFKPLHQREFRSLITPFTRINWSKIMFAFFCWLGLTLMFESVAYFIEPENYSFHFNFKTFVPLLLISMLILPLQTSMEELLFRGYMLQGLGLTKTKHILGFILSLFFGYGLYKIVCGSAGLTVADPSLRQMFAKMGIALLGILATVLLFMFLYRLFNKIELGENHWLDHHTRWLPLIITSIMFGLIHSMNPEIKEYGFYTMQLYYVSAGLVLGIMTIMDDGLELAFGVHAATNFSGAVFVGYTGAAIQTDALFKTQLVNPQLMTIFFFVISALFLLMLRYKFNWSSFSKIFKPIEVPDKNKDIDHLIDIL